VTDAGFDKYAETYDAALDEAIGVSGENREFFAHGRVAWMARLVPSRPGASRVILDFGCGTGSSVPLLLGGLAATAVVGVDVSSRSIEVARRTHPSPVTSFFPMDEYRPRGEVDLAYCNGVFHHIPPPERAVAVDYVHRALHPGGLFAFWENNPWNPATRFVMSRCAFDRDAVTLTPPEARRLLEAGGFEVLRTDFLFIFPRALRWLRGIEPMVSRFPLGTQYLVLCRKVCPRS